MPLIGMSATLPADMRLCWFCGDEYDALRGPCQTCPTLSAAQARQIFLDHSFASYADLAAWCEARYATCPDAEMLALRTAAEEGHVHG